MRKLLAILLSTILVLSFSACGSDGGAEDKSKDTASEKNVEDSQVLIDDIDWVAETAIIDGERKLVVNYKNNSEYPMFGIDIDFVQKPDVTEKQVDDFETFFKKKYKDHVSDDDIKDLEENGIKMSARTQEMKIAEPGDTVKNNIYCYYGDHAFGIFDVEDDEYYDLLEPNIATIVYIDGDMVRTFYYDFTSESYTPEEDGTFETQQWSTSKLGKVTPKVDARVVRVTNDDAGYFTFDAYGVSEDTYDTYVQSCKDAGFNKKVDEWDGYFYAESDEGYTISVSYGSDLNVTVEKKKK